MIGVDAQMRQYNQWFTRGCPDSDTISYTGRPMPDLHVAPPPVMTEEE